MSDDVRKKAQAALAEVEKVTQAILPEPVNALVPLETADKATGAEIKKRMAEIDMDNTGSIVGFGSRAQSGLQEISQSMLQGVRNKDVGPAGDSLREIVTTIRGFSVSELDVRRKRSWWERLTGSAAPMAKFVARYENVQSQIDKVTDDLLRHEHTLLKDIESLDQLYDKTLAFYDELALYIAAGEAKLEELDGKTIPAKEAKVAKAKDDKAVMEAQELRDLRAARDDLERRVHDLKLTRQVTMQSLPSIRLVQENDKSLVTKINSTLVNTVPLWETQLAQAVTIQRSAEAAGAVRRRVGSSFTKAGLGGTAAGAGISIRGGVRVRPATDTAKATTATAATTKSARRSGAGWAGAAGMRGRGSTMRRGQWVASRVRTQKASSPPRKNVRGAFARAPSGARLMMARRSRRFCTPPTTRKARVHCQRRFRSTVSRPSTLPSSVEGSAKAPLPSTRRGSPL